MTKTFDCVETKRRGAEALLARLDAMTEDEQDAYWERRNRELAEEVRQAKERHAASTDHPTQP
jgi:hypothetical protein